MCVNKINVCGINKTKVHHIFLNKGLQLILNNSSKCLQTVIDKHYETVRTFGNFSKKKRQFPSMEDLEIGIVLTQTRAKIHLVLRVAYGLKRR